jgi:putative ABC transport system permease protein
MSFGDLIRRARFWIRRNRLADELDEEMRLHVELRARANRERGMPPDDADLAAKRQFGNRLALREAGRDAWGFVAFERVLQDLRYGVRQLIKHRGVTAAAVLTLALGIGANTALFTAINAVLLRPAPAADPDRLVWLVGTTTHSINLEPLSYADYRVYRERTDVFQGVAAFAATHLSAGGADPTRVAGVIVSTNYFDVLGVRAQLGRTFSPTDDSASGDRVAVIGDGFWRRRYGGAADVVGRAITLNGRPFVIVGVLPRGFSGLEMPDMEVPAVWVPVETAPIAMPDRATVLTDPREKWLWAAGRLQPDVSISGAAATVATLAAHAPSVLPASPRSATVLPIKGGLLPDERREVAPVLLLVMVVPGLVLVVACANVANLLLARGVARRRELALRRAIGATRSRLVRQLLTESLMLSLMGAVMAMGVSAGFVQVIGALADMPRPMLGAMTVDARVFSLTMAVGVLSVLIFGLSPALSATSSPLASTLNDEVGAVDAKGRRRRLGRAFVVTQIAVSMALLITAGLFLQSLGKALRVNPGFDPRNVLTFSYDLALQGYAPPRHAEFHRAVLERVRTTPGVESAALAAQLPLSQAGFGQSLQPESTDRRALPVNFSSVSPGYFETIGLNLVGGRDFSTLDVLGKPEVAIVNETLARQLSPDAEVFGKRFRFARPGEPWRTIVGVARDSKYASLTELPMPFVYLPWAQWPRPTASVLARMRGDAKTIVPLVVNEVRRLDSDLPLYQVSMLEQDIGRSMGVQRGASSLLAVFGVLALLLAALGIYGVTAHGVTLRTKEIGIRMSLGAQAPQVVGMFVGEGLRLSTVGVAVGLALSAAAARVLETFLFGLHATDAMTFAAVAVLLCSVAMLASYLPARRAAGMDPLRALRHE